MNDRELDLLIQHAFGDADVADRAEAAKLAERSPAEAALWAQLKSDLRSLNDIPECQMSVERLQNAILNKTKKEAVRGWSLAKVFAGVGGAVACAFGLMLTFNMMKSADPEKIVGKRPSTDVALNSEQPSPVRPTELFARPPVKESNSKKMGQQAEAEEEPAPQIIRVPRARGHETPSPSPIESDEGNGAFQSKAVPAADSGNPRMLTVPAVARGGAGSGAPGAGFDRDQVMGDASENPEDSVVIVEASTNRDGTRQAVEVRRDDEDVVFGG